MKLFPGSVTNKARSIQGFWANPLDANKKAGFWAQEIVYQFRNSEGRLDLHDPGKGSSGRGLEKLCERMSPEYTSYLWPVTNYHQNLEV